MNFIQAIAAARRVPSTVPGIVTANLYHDYNPENYSGSGTTYTDDQGNANASLIGGLDTSYNSGPPAYFDNDGTIDRAINTSTSVNNLSAMSAQVWCYPYTTATDGTVLGNWSNSFLLYLDEGGANAGYRALARLTNGSAVGTSVNNAGATANTWQLVTMTFTSTSLKLYVNSTLIESVSTGLNMGQSGATGFSIGSDGPYTATRTFYGRFGRVLWYSAELSATDVAQNYNAMKSNYGL